MLLWLWPPPADLFPFLVWYIASNRRLLSCVTYWHICPNREAFHVRAFVESKLARPCERGTLIGRCQKRESVDKFTCDFPGTQRRDHEPRPGPGRRDEEAGGQHPAPRRTPPGPAPVPGPLVFFFRHPLHRSCHPPPAFSTWK